MLSQNTKTELLTLVGKTSPGLALNQKMELEARFGLIGARESSNKVDRRTFTQLLRELKRKYKWEYSHTKDSYYRQELPQKDNARERYSVVYGENDEVVERHRMVKTNIKNFDEAVKNYNIRIGFSVEQTDSEQEPNNVSPKHIRDKKRWSFPIRNLFILDMTEVTRTEIADKVSKPSDTKTSYEIELEVQDMLRFNADMLEQFEKVIILLATEITHTVFLYTSQQKMDLIRKINKFIKAKQVEDKEPQNLKLREMVASGDILDIEAITQARNLKVRDMILSGIVPATDKSWYYSVTAKADGIRQFLVISSNGIYLVYPPSSINLIIPSSYMTPVFKNYWGTVIECEWIPKESMTESTSEEARNTKYYLMVYDVLSFAGKSVQHLHHGDRLNYADKIMLLLSKSPSVLILEKKEFRSFRTVDEFYKSVNHVLDQPWPFLTDGLIFTPENFIYHTGLGSRSNISDRSLSKRPDICKWKPVWTIDFRIVKKSDGNGDWIELETANEPFVGTNNFPFNSKTGVEITDLIKDVANGTIVEFRWDYDLEKFVALKVRDDKPFPNTKSVADDVWDDIHHMIKEDIMRGLSFGLSFRYHNRVKWELFGDVGKRLTGQKKILLDIGSGKGGDKDKIEAAGFTDVIFVEPNAENRAELERRVKNARFNYTILDFDAIKQWEDIVRVVFEKYPEGVDAISYMLSLSFFYLTQEGIDSVIRLIYSSLKVGGLFFGLTLDAKWVAEFFNDPYNFTTEEDGGMRANLRGITYKLYNLDPENSYPYIYIDIPNSIVRTQTEGIPNLEILKANLINIGLQELSEKRTVGEPFMTLEERYFVRQFSSFIYVRESIPQF